jgi:type II secretory pathway component PulF
MLIVFTLIVGALLFWIVPQFAEVIIGFAIPLPWITTALIATSQFCRDNGLWIVAAAFAIPLALWLIFRLALGPAHFRRLVCRIPLVGPALRWAGLSRFSQLLALLIENRVPLDEALVLAGDASGDAEIRDDCRQITAEISAGESLVEVARRRRFPASFARALTWDRRHQGLPEIMQSLGDVYASRVRAVVSLLMAILPPLLIIVMGAVVFIVMVALFAPLIRLLNMLS